MSQVCPSCGARGQGKFCSECGTGLGPSTCPGCGHALGPGARFCTACGARQRGWEAPTPPARTFPVLPVAVAAVAVIALILVLVQRNEPPAFPDQAGVGAPFAGVGSGTPPDLSTMTPREQFNRLFDRVMMAAEQGDTATVASFSPMALQAYQNLSEVDADARYHAAMLKLHTGDTDGAKALADSILAIQPDHLFGYVLHAALARFRGDQADLRRIQDRFLAAWDREMAAGRQEYNDHRTVLDQFEQSARRP